MTEQSPQVFDFSDYPSRLRTRRGQDNPRRGIKASAGQHALEYRSDASKAQALRRKQEYINRKRGQETKQHVQHVEHVEHVAAAEPDVPSQVISALLHELSERSDRWDASMISSIHVTLQHLCNAGAERPQDVARLVATPDCHTLIAHLLAHPKATHDGHAALCNLLLLQTRFGPQISVESAILFLPLLVPIWASLHALLIYAEWTNMSENAQLTVLEVADACLMIFMRALDSGGSESVKNIELSALIRIHDVRIMVHAANEHAASNNRLANALLGFLSRLSSCWSMELPAPFVAPLALLVQRSLPSEVVSEACFTMANIIIDDVTRREVHADKKIEGRDFRDEAIDYFLCTRSALENVVSMVIRPQWKGKRQHEFMRSATYLLSSLALYGTKHQRELLLAQDICMALGVALEYVTEANVIRDSIRALRHVMMRHEYSSQWWFESEDRVWQCIKHATEFPDKKVYGYAVELVNREDLYRLSETSPQQDEWDKMPTSARIQKALAVQCKMVQDAYSKAC